MCGGGGDASREIERQNLQRQQAIQAGMANIDSVFSGFGPQYFEGVRKNALAQTMPQFERQYRGARKGLAYSLADRGLLNSSAAREGATALETQRGFGQTAVVNQAEDAVRQVRGQIGNERATAVNQLVASQDPALAAQQAVAGAANIQAPSMVAPLGNMFQTFADSWMANKVGQTYAQPAAGASPSGGRLSSVLGSNYFRR